MRTKPRLTVDEHQNIDHNLAYIRDFLRAIAHTLEGCLLPGSDWLPVRKLRDAYEAVDEARSALDSILFREHPADATSDVYYPMQQTPRHRQAICAAEGTKRVHGQELVVICNRQPHDGNQHHDFVHGDWTGTADTNPEPQPQI